MTEQTEQQKLARKVRYCESVLRSYFSQIQDMYDYSLNMKTESEESTYLAKTFNVTTLRAEFMVKLEDWNMMQMEQNPSYEPSFKKWEAFEALYNYVQTKISEIKTKDLHKVSHEVRLNSPQVRLPPVQLPKFDSDPKAWPMFIECFNSTIHNNSQLTNAEKVYYLCGQLTGKALDSIAGLIPTGDNYELIYNTLVDKYQDVRTLATAYMDEIFNLNKLQVSSVEGLNMFIDRFTVAVSALERLDINKLDFIYLYIALKKVDSETARLFENSVRGELVPSYSSFVKFVKEQAKILERTGPVSISSEKGTLRFNNVRTPMTTKPIPVPGKNTKSFATTDDGTACPLCTGSHDYLSKCTEFLRRSSKERFVLVKKHNACVNCLSLRHRASACNSKGICNTCQAKTHHTLLHFPNLQSSSTSLPVSGDSQVEVVDSDRGYDELLLDDDASQAGVSLCSMGSTKTQPSVSGVRSSTVLLATAKVLVRDTHGVSHMVRCLIDSGSQNHFITAQCCKRLSLASRKPASPISVHGFGGGVNRIQGVTELEFSSRLDKGEVFQIQPLVVESIVNELPTSTIDMSVLSYLSSVPLADDTFQVPGEVELLIGAQLFARLLLNGKVRGPPGMPDAIQTRLGFIIMGDVPALTCDKAGSTGTYCAFMEPPNIQEAVSKFWQLEEVPASTSACHSLEEQECEDIYKMTTSRDASGRYAVALPFKADPVGLGSSYQTAQKRFYALERRLQAAPELRKAYEDVIKEYLDVGYVTPVAITEEPGAEEGYVIPHHFVLREGKVTTKLRIVLDASAYTDRQHSLNEVLHAGPNLQGDIFTLLLNFRLFAVAFCADVKQMYLQIKVHPQYCKFLRLLYRFDPNDQLQMFEFNRVCFGLTSSPYLALRTVKQLCEDEQRNFPVAAKVVESGLYMDDVVYSENSLATATETVLQLIGMFKAGGFDLMKWSSNSPDLLAQVPETHLHPQVHSFNDDGHKILGVKWEPRSDAFSFEVASCPEECTKRNVLSVVARLWDVLGFVAPVILYAKLLIRDLWELHIGWDDVPPRHVVEKWTRFKAELQLLTRLVVPRHIGVGGDNIVTLAAFSDASEQAYGAAVYIHCETTDGVRVSLLCAKSRVAPLKTVSVARLELCAALLMAKLVRVVLDNYERRCKIDRILAFTDSTVTLHWIHASPHKWKTFVANRVAKIQEQLSPAHFHHIAGKVNPSDCLSRGLSPAQLLDHPLWFVGPPWLRGESSLWPIHPFRTDTEEPVPEAKIVSLVVAEPVKPILYDLAQRVSSWSKLLRTTVYVLRFVKRLRSHGIPQAEDLVQAELAIVRSVQAVHFAEAIRAVRAGRACSKALQKLRPFIVDGVLRVGGRLGNFASLTFDHKHPMLLPQKDHVVNILIDYTHCKNCHVGPHLLLSILRQRFWILTGRNIVRSRVHLCNQCFRARPKACTPPVMADLPECRLQVSKPFSHTGLDYGGPINITLSRGRGIRSQKAYICVFICLTTRAVHVELVPDLSTEAFLNALKRFLSRRGNVDRLFSDNGTNFVGARAYLDELHEFLQSEEHTKQWYRELANQRIQWQMIPPNAPHFGGGWEATVKSFKTHLVRVIGAQLLTYEELLTVLTQIEAVLNSRPLGQVLGSDPAEPVPLTPSHFLHTVPLSTLPSAPVMEKVDKLRSRFVLIDKLVQSYWNRWSTEYLNTLQAREKWLTDPNPINKGTVVLIMQNNTSPLHWPLGVIQETYPGSDRRTRVVLVKTKGGTLKRAVARLCPLPSQ